MKQLSFDYQNASKFLKKHEIDFIKDQVTNAANLLDRRQGPGNDFLGWLDLPTSQSAEMIAQVKATAEQIRKQSEVLIVIGIGGSFLGAKSAIDFLGTSLFNAMNKEDRNAPEIYFAGTNISGVYLSNLMKIIGDRDYSVNMISKSGTTTEPAIAFRFLKKHLEDKYGKAGAKDRIIVTTDKKRGALKNLANQEGYTSFVIPDDVGGRFSVLTPVGLLPIAVAGFDVSDLL